MVFLCILDRELPKTKLYLYTVKNNLKLPKYEVTQKVKLFRAIVLVGDTKYSSSFWEKSKKYAEQSAALTGLLHLGILSKEKLIENGTMIG